MALGGPMASSVMKRYIPGPGQYKNDTSTLVRDDHVPQLRSRLPDKSYDHLKKVKNSKSPYRPRPPRNEDSEEEE